jgi:hypothetical protein
MFHGIPLALLVHADAGTKQGITNASIAANIRIMNGCSVTVQAERAQLVTAQPRLGFHFTVAVQQRPEANAH